MSKTHKYARSIVIAATLLTSGVTSSASNAQTYAPRDQSLGVLGDLVGLPGAVLGRAFATRDASDAAEPGFYDVCDVARRPVFDYDGNFRGYRLASPC